VLVPGSLPGPGRSPVIRQREGRRRAWAGCEVIVDRRSLHPVQERFEGRGAVSPLGER